MIPENPESRKTARENAIGGNPNTNGHRPGKPIPLTQAVEVPPFPVDALPKPIADMVLAVAEATQTDPAMAGTSALSALSACTGGHAVIEVRPGWREPLNIYTVTIADIAERKSAVQETMVRPIHNAEREIADQGRAERTAAQTRKKIAVDRANKLQKDAAKIDDENERVAAKMNDAIAAAGWADMIVVPPIPRIVADDITPEATASLLAEQGGQLAIISAEGGIFDMFTGRYSNSVNLDVFLKGHPGDPLRVDRKSGPPEHVDHPALTLGLMIQPAVLSEIAASRPLRGRGLLARFLYSRPASKVGHREIARPPVSEEVEKCYEDTVTELAVGMRSMEVVLTLSLKAEDMMTAIEKAVEPHLAPDGGLDVIRDWGGKYVGAIARIAGILHFALHGVKSEDEYDSWEIPVAVQTISAAMRIGEYFRASAINTFLEMGADKITTDAEYLLDRIRHLGFDEVSEQELHARCQSRFHKKADLKPAVDRLVDHGFLVPLPPGGPTGGRPKSPSYTVCAKEEA